MTDKRQPNAHHAPIAEMKRWKFTPSAATFQQLKANYDGSIDDKALIEGANKGLVAAAGDIHTEYFTEKEAKQFNSDLSGNIGGGIGAEVGMREEKPTIIGTLADTPAAKSDLKPGDVIVSVNDEAVNGLTVDQVVQKIRGEIGTTVKISYLRDGSVKDVTLTRQEITSPSVTSKVEGDTGVLTVARFNNDTGTQARAAAQDLRSKNVKKIILDLRDNGGGTLEAAPALASLWLDDKIVVSERIGSKTIAEQRSGSNAILAGLPTVILVNGGTASASEIVTAALKEYGAASVVGEKTYGKGTVQTIIDINNGAMLKVTIQRWYTPKGNNVDKKGITPDRAVELTKDDVNANRDPQLEAAKQRLNG
ncbi:S41 family peptidase [bacterium]|nr:MAG: S41 family peptidase [bacterium]